MGNTASGTVEYESVVNSENNSENNLENNLDSQENIKLTYNLDVKTVYEYVKTERVTFSDFEIFIENNVSFLKKNENDMTLLMMFICMSECNTEMMKCVDLLIIFSKKSETDNVLPEEYVHQLFSQTYNDPQWIRYLMEKELDINSKNSLGDNVFAHFIRQNNLHPIKSEIQQQWFTCLKGSGLNVNAQNNNDQTENQQQWFKCLKDSGLNVNAQNNDGQTQLHIACQTEIQQQWFKCLKDSGLNVNAQNNDGQTPLHIACQTEDVNNIIEQLLEIGADPNIKDKDGITPLMLTVINRLPVKKMDILIKFGADINIRSNSNRKVVDYAIAETIHCLEHIHNLLLLKPKIRTKYIDGDTRLMCFVRKINIDLKKIICSCCGCHYMRPDERVRFILLIIKQFIELGIDINSRNKQKETAIHLMIDGNFLNHKIFKNTIRLMENPKSQTYGKHSLFSYTVLKLKNDRFALKVEENVLFVLKCLMDVPVMITRKDMNNIEAVILEYHKKQRLRRAEQLRLIHVEMANLYNLQKINKKEEKE